VQKFCPVGKHQWEKLSSCIQRCTKETEEEFGAKGNHYF